LNRIYRAPFQPKEMLVWLEESTLSLSGKPMEHFDCRSGSKESTLKPRCHLSYSESTL